jgi:L-asparaginase / beta-aspartyl-peptidase
MARTLDAGAIAGVRGVRNPVLLARAVIEKCEHVFLIGEGAERFARDHSQANERKLGAVGAVARDRSGNLAAATSTGGLVNQQWGRVGDSASIGAGVFADNASCAVSCTGIGEHLGVGAARRVSAVRWNIAKNIVVAWVITKPMAGVIAAIFYALARSVG